MDRTPGYITRAIRNKDREKSSGKTQLFNIWTIGAKVKLSGIFSPFYEDAFNPRSFDISPDLGLPPSIQSHSPLCIATQIIDC
jgi:hypothetical protein